MSMPSTPGTPWSDSSYGCMQNDEAACHAVNPASIPPPAQNWRQELKQEILGEMRKGMKELTQELTRDIVREIRPSRPTAGTRARTQSPEPHRPRFAHWQVQRSSYEWDVDGRPICFQCRRPGHMARVCRSNLGDLRRKVRLLEDRNAELEKKVAYLQRENHTLCVQEVTHRESLAQVQVQLVEAQQVEEALETEDRSNRRQMQEMRAEMEELREALQGRGSRTEGPWEELRSVNEERGQRRACRGLVREPRCEKNDEVSYAQVQQQCPGGAESLVAEVIPAQHKDTVASPQREAMWVHSQPERPTVEVGVHSMDIRFEKRDYPQITPKMNLVEWSREEGLEQPFYETIQRPQDRAFQSTVTVAGKRYGSTLWEKSKKFAEQAAAIVCLRVLGLPEGHIDKEDQDPVWRRGALDRAEPQVDGDIEVGVYSEWKRKRDEDAKWMEENYKCWLGEL